MMPDVVRELMEVRKRALLKQVSLDSVTVRVDPVAAAEIVLWWNQTRLPGDPAAPLPERLFGMRLVQDPGVEGVYVQA